MATTYGTPWFSGWGGANLESFGNLGKSTTEQATSAIKNALQQMQNYTGNVENILGQYGQTLPTARNKAMAGMTGASNYFQNVGQQALQNYRGTLDQLGQSVLTGQVPAQYQAALDKLRQNQYEQVQKQLNQAAGTYGRNIFETLGSKGMMDSTRATEALLGVNRGYLSSLQDAARAIENSYLTAMLEQPYKAYSTLQPAEQNFMAALLANAADVAKLQQGTAQYGYTSAADVYNQLLGGAMQATTLPSTYAGIASELPQWPAAYQQQYLSGLLGLWRDLLQAQLTREQMENQLKIANIQAETNKYTADKANDFGWKDVLNILF